MIKTLFTPLFTSLFTSLFTLLSATVVLSVGSIAAADDKSECTLGFKEVQNTYTKSNFEATVIDSAQIAMEPFALDHAYKNGVSYTIWKTLNNEVEGYALRNDRGFDFNHDQSFIGILTWHQSRLWDKIFNTNTQLKGYDCSYLGRTRLAGRSVMLMRLSPVDEMRYTFVLARDEDTNLPVELAVLTPEQMVSAKFTVTAVNAGASDKYTLTDETFDQVEKLSKKPQTNLANPWRELTIPGNFHMIANGVQSMEDGKKVSYQEFSDGLISFRVYRNSKATLSVPTATEGTISVYRATDSHYEYAVVGEIPLKLCHLVLSKIIGAK